MNDGSNETPGAIVGFRGHRPALQVICLGTGGGPREDEVTGMVVRSIASDWAKNSLLAVDAGSHLGPIVKILENHFPSISSNPSQGNGVLSRSLARTSLSPSPDEDEGRVKPEPTVLSNGPFAGLKFPWASARANALHVVQTYVKSYLITHAHLDHLAGFAINTAAFHSTASAKTLAALPSTVAAIRDHIFNDIIWPNLSDEDGGVGFVTFQRLKEGGDVMIGEGEGRGYIEVCDGLSVKAFKVSHGTCTKSPPTHRHRGSIAGLDNILPPYNGSIAGSTQVEYPSSMQRTNSQFSQPGTPGQIQRGPSFYQSQHPSPHLTGADSPSCVVDSTAFFIRDTAVHREVLIFGDVEPDSISLSPRNHYVWAEAARKIAHGILGGIFIECSYDDNQPDHVLFGHLNPKHLIAELQNLARMVTEAQRTRSFEKGVKKRKRSGANGLETPAQHVMAEKDRGKRSRSLASRSNMSRDSRRSSVPDHSMPDAYTHGQISTSPSADSLSQIQIEHMEQSHHGPPVEPVSPRTARPLPVQAGAVSTQDLPLAGVKIVIIHIKDTMKDGPHVRDNILEQLQDYELRLQASGEGLGCEFVISQTGESYWF